MTEQGENPLQVEEQKPGISAGERLRGAREALNFSQQDIATRLRLKIEVIRALEADQYDRLEAPIFVRGYIRSYAMQVGVAPEEVVEAFNRIMGEPEAPPMMKQPSVGKIKTKISSGPSLLSIVIAVIAVLVLIGGIWWYLQDKQQAPVNEPAGSTGETVMPPAEKKVELPPVSIDENKSSTLPLPPAVTTNESHTTADTKPAAVTEKPVTPPPVVTAPVVKPPVVTQPVDVEGEKLQVRCTADSWVEIRDASDKRLVYRLVKNNETLEVSGKLPFQLLLGNAKGISLELNGKPYDFSSHVRGKVARFRIEKE